MKTPIEDKRDPKAILYVGLDGHQESISVAVAEATGQREVRSHGLGVAGIEESGCAADTGIRLLPVVDNLSASLEPQVMLTAGVVASSAK